MTGINLNITHTNHNLMGKYQSFDCVKVYGSNGVLLYIEAWWMDMSDPSGKNYQLARYCIMFPLSRMIAILQNLEKDGGINPKKNKSTLANNNTKGPKNAWNGRFYSRLLAIFRRKYL